MTSASRPAVNGEVWLNDRRTDAKFAPYVCQFGFWLKNEAAGWGGPHFEIALAPEQFAELLDSSGGPLRVQLSEGRLGKVDECNGYAAADVGSRSRPMTSLSLHVFRLGRSTRFEFNGETGFVDPATAYGGGISPERHPYWTFFIWFIVPDDQIGCYFVERVGRDAMTRFVERCGNG